MWKAFTGKSSEKADEPSSKTPRRKDKDEESTVSTRRRSDSIPPSTSAKKSSRGDDRGKGFNPSSTSYSSTSRSPYPGTAAASVASSYATADPGQHMNDRYHPPDLIRNESMVDRVPKSRASQDDHTESNERDRRSERRRERSPSPERKRHRNERDDKRRENKDSGDSSGRTPKEKKRTRSGDDYQDYSNARPVQSNNNFASEIGATEFSQFPGQYDGGLPGHSPQPTHSPDNLDSRVPHQFPGQFPSGTTQPYRPPLAKDEGGPGLATDYYNDHGESVALQPGVRPAPPPIIVGAEPHLHEASIEAKPPPEPSSLGHVGAAADFFAMTSDAEIESSTKPTKPVKSSKTRKSSRSSKHPSQAVKDPGGPSRPGPNPVSILSGSFSGNYSQTQTASHAGEAASYYTAASNFDTPTVQNNPHSISNPIIPAAGATAAGYMMSQHSSSHGQADYHSQSMGSNFNPNNNTYAQRLPSQTNPAWNPSLDPKPLRPGKTPSSTSNMPLYAAGAVGAAGIAAAAHHNNHHNAAQNSYTTYGQNGTPMTYRHRHHGPLGKVVDFFKDPAAVAEFEEYTEYIGVCKYCFDPGSSPRDAPRKHHHKRRRYSNERYGSSTRVDKLSRYASSDEERKKSSKKGWVATGLAGYGIAKLGQSLFNQKDFDNSYSVRSGRPHESRISLHGNESNASLGRKSYTSHGVTRKSSHRSRSRERIETGMTSDGKVYKKDPHGGFLGGPTMTEYGIRRRSRSRSRSKSRDRRSNVLMGAAFGAAVGTAATASSKQRHRSRSTSPKKRRSKRRGSPNTSFVDLQHTNSRPDNAGLGTFFSAPSENRRKSKKSKGFFNFNNGSSSSSDADLAFGTGHIRRKKSARSPEKGKRKEHDVDAAILGLGATAAALAAANSRHNSTNKHRADLVAVKESRQKERRHRESHRKRRPSSPSSQSDNDAGWESASDDESASVDSALAYGGRSALQSKESLISDPGTSKWDWRWGSKKEKRKKPSPPLYPENYGPETASFAGPVAAGIAGGIAGAAMAANHQAGGNSSVASLPSMQHVYPIPTSDPNVYDVGRRTSGAPSTAYAPPPYEMRPTAPLYEPQPIASVSQAVFATQGLPGQSYYAPTGPPVFSDPHYQPSQALGEPLTDSPDQMPADSYRRKEDADTSTPRDARKDKSRRRRDSSSSFPTSQERVDPKTARRRSTRDQFSSVQFDLSQEQTDRERQSAYRTERQKDEDRKQEKARLEEDQAELSHREKRRLDEEDEDRRRKAEALESEQQAEIDRERRRAEKERERHRKNSKSSKEKTDDPTKELAEKERKSSMSARDAVNESEEFTPKKLARSDTLSREEEIERELERLYEEERKQSNEKKKRSPDSWAAPVAGAAAVAAVAASVVPKAVDTEESEDEAERRRRRRERRRERERKENEANIAERDPSRGPPERSDSMQRRIAADRARSGSPAHDDYASYFIPPELREHLKEHNVESEHRNAPTETDPQIIEVVPSGTNPSPFPRDLYRPFGIYPEDDPLKFPWPVPRLGLIEPTPPPSRAGSVRGDASPMIMPQDDEEEEIRAPKKPSTGSKVTWGEHQTHEYDVVTPLDDHEEFIREFKTDDHASDSTRSQSAASKPQKSSPLAQVSESIVERPSPHNMETLEEQHDQPERDASSPHIPGAFDDDIDFAATLAAGAQEAGFDPSIVINDPTYRRRDSPPGSETHGSYQSPFTVSVSDLGIKPSSTTTAPPQQGFVEGELPPTPQVEPYTSLSRHYSQADDVDDKEKPGKTSDAYSPAFAAAAAVATAAALESFDNPEISKKEQRKRDKKAKRMSADDKSGVLLDRIVEPVEVRSVFADPGEYKGRQETRASDQPSVFDYMEGTSPNVPGERKPETIDDEYFGKVQDPTGEYQNGHQHHEKTEEPTDLPESLGENGPANSEQRRRKKLNRDAEVYASREDDSQSLPDDLDDRKRSKRRSKRESEVFDVSPDDSRSVAASAPGADEFYEGKKSKKKSKRDSANFDDAMSVASSPAKYDDTKEPKRKSKDKKGSGGIFGLFSSGRSDDSASNKRDSKETPSEATFEDFEEPKKKSKRKSKDRQSTADAYDVYSGAAQSVSDLSQTGKQSAEDEGHTDDLEKRKERQEKRRSRYGDIVDSARHNSEERDVEKYDDSRDTTRPTQDEDSMSFLGERPELPPLPDGASGSYFSSVVQAGPQLATPAASTSAGTDLTRARSRSASPLTTHPNIGVADTSRTRAASPSPIRFRPQRPLSEVQTPDADIATPSASTPGTIRTTAVPLHFRRPPASPAAAKSPSHSSPVAASPQSPLSTPRTRTGRPNSTEFTGKDFRPLYLVERHNSVKIEPEEDENYPSLPSSRTSSQHPSIEDLRETVRDEVFVNRSPDFHSRRPAELYIPDDRGHDYSDILGSEQTTPTAATFQRPIKKEKPKYEFHSPSELLYDAPEPEHGYEVLPQSASVSPVMLPKALSSDSLDRPMSKQQDITPELHDLPALPDSRPSSPIRERSRSRSDSGFWKGAAIGAAGAAAIVAATVHHEGRRDDTADHERKQQTPVESPHELVPQEQFEDKRPGEPEASSVVEDEPVEDPLLQRSSSKKSKKDKKSKKKSRVLDLTDEPEEVSTGMASSEEPDLNAETMQLPTLSAEDPKVEAEPLDKPAQLQGAERDEQVTQEPDTFEMSSKKSKKDKKSKKKSRVFDLVEEQEELSSGISTPAEPAAESSQQQEPSEVTARGTDADDWPTEQAVEAQPEDLVFEAPSRKSKKEKKAKKKIFTSDLAELDENVTEFTTTEPTFDAEPRPLPPVTDQDLAAEVQPEGTPATFEDAKGEQEAVEPNDFFETPNNKSKKDKKKKKGRRSTFDDDFVGDSGAASSNSVPQSVVPDTTASESPILAVPVEVDLVKAEPISEKGVSDVSAPVEEKGVLAADEEDKWQEPPAKSKKGKKKQKKQTLDLWGEDEPAAPSEVGRALEQAPHSNSPAVAEELEPNFGDLSTLAKGPVEAHDPDPSIYVEDNAAAEPSEPLLSRKTSKKDKKKQKLDYWATVEEAIEPPRQPTPEQTFAVPAGVANQEVPHNDHDVRLHGVSESMVVEDQPRSMEADMAGSDTVLQPETGTPDLADRSIPALSDPHLSLLEEALENAKAARGVPMDDVWAEEEFYEADANVSAESQDFWGLSRDEQSQPEHETVLDAPFQRRISHDTPSALLEDVEVPAYIRPQLREDQLASAIHFASPLGSIPESDPMSLAEAAEPIRADQPTVQLSERPPRPRSPTSSQEDLTVEPAAIDASYNGGTESAALEQEPDKQNEEDEWATSSKKKSKKDKKKKRQSVVLDDSVPSQGDPVEPVSTVEIPAQVIEEPPLGALEPTRSVEVETEDPAFETPMVTPMETPSEMPGAFESPQQETTEFSRAPATKKKGKKDKKARKSLASEDGDPPIQNNTFQPETLAGDTVSEFKDQTQELETTREDEWNDEPRKTTATIEPSQEEPHEFSWAPITKKKGKKDKRRSLTVEDLGASEADVFQPDTPAVESVPEVSVTKPEPETPMNASREGLTEIPESLDPLPTDEPEDYSWEPTTSKGKKDKKKKRQTVAFEDVASFSGIADEGEAPVGEAVPEVQEQMRALEASQKILPTEPAEIPPVIEPPQEEVDDFSWAAPSKKSKKDKKKKQSQAFEVPEPSREDVSQSNLPTQEPNPRADEVESLADPPTEEPVGIEDSFETPREEPENFSWGLTTKKKGKKEKKTKNVSLAFEDSLPPSEEPQAGTIVDEPVFPIQEQLQQPETPLAVTREAPVEATEVVLTLQEEPEEFSWGSVPTKKSKKDKKKRHSLAFDDTVPPSDDITESLTKEPAPEIEQPAQEGEILTKLEKDEPVGTSHQDPEDFSWGPVSVKRSKKDKKKLKSLIWQDELDSPASQGAIEETVQRLPEFESVTEPTQALPVEDTTKPEVELSDPFKAAVDATLEVEETKNEPPSEEMLQDDNEGLLASSSKKKKAKKEKKKKQSLAWDDEDPSAPPESPINEHTETVRNVPLADELTTPKSDPYSTPSAVFETAPLPTEILEEQALENVSNNQAYLASEPSIWENDAAISERVKDLMSGKNSTNAVAEEPSVSTTLSSNSIMAVASEMETPSLEEMAEPIEDEAEDLWSTGKKKKSKKGKKRDTLSGAIEPGMPDAVAETLPTSDVGSEPAISEPRDRSLTSRDIESTSMPTVTEQDILAGEDRDVPLDDFDTGIEEIPEPTGEVPESFWSLPSSKKKSKKGRKVRDEEASSGTATPSNTAGFTAAALVATEVVGAITVEKALESDVPAPKLSKKDKKKKKVQAFDWDEPAPEMTEDATPGVTAEEENQIPAEEAVQNQSADTVAQFDAASVSPPEMPDAARQALQNFYSQDFMPAPAARRPKPASPKPSQEKKDKKVEKARPGLDARATSPTLGPANPKEAPVEATREPQLESPSEVDEAPHEIAIAEPLTRGVQAEPTVEQLPLEKATEDAWDEFKPKKKGKKDKKRSRGQSIFEEPPPEPEPEHKRRETSEALEAMDLVDEQVPVDTLKNATVARDIDMAQDEPLTAIQDEPIADDVWDLPSTKRKDKKKSKKTKVTSEEPSSGQMTPAVEEPEDLGISPGQPTELEPMLPDGIPKTLESASRSMPGGFEDFQEVKVEEEMPQEEEPVWPTVSSKKGKKDKKKKSRQLDFPELEQPPMTAPLTSEPLLVERMEESHEQAREEVPDFFKEADTEIATIETGPVPEDTEVQDDEWGSFSTKKSKKDKKQKSKQIDFIEAEAEPEIATVTSEPIVAEPLEVNAATTFDEPLVRSEAIDEETPTANAAPIEAAVLQEEADAQDDEWGSFSTKKSKKDKKKKSRQLDFTELVNDLDLRPDLFGPLPAVPVDEARILASDEPVTSAREEKDEPPPVSEDAPAESTYASEAAAVQDDEWGSFSTKKSKKGKKAKKGQQLEAVQELESKSASATSSRPDVSMTEDAVEPTLAELKKDEGVDDLWGAPVKKGKKGKKDKRQGSLMLEDEEINPVVEEGADDRGPPASREVFDGDAKATTVIEPARTVESQPSQKSGKLANIFPNLERVSLKSPPLSPNGPGGAGFHSRGPSIDEKIEEAKKAKDMVTETVSAAASREDEERQSLNIGKTLAGGAGMVGLGALAARPSHPDADSPHKFAEAEAIIDAEQGLAFTPFLPAIGQDRLPESGRAAANLENVDLDMHSHNSIGQDRLAYPRAAADYLTQGYLTRAESPIIQAPANSAIGQDRLPYPDDAAAVFTMAHEALHDVKGLGLQNMHDTMTPDTDLRKDYPRSSGGRAQRRSYNRDSAVHVSDSPSIPHQVVRDSGYVPSPLLESVRDSSMEPKGNLRPPRPLTPTSSQEDLGETKRKRHSQISVDSAREDSTTTSSNAPLNVEVEHDPTYDISVSRPAAEDGRRGSVEVHWGGGVGRREFEDPVTTRAFDPEERITPAKDIHRNGQPPEVDSTTKDRSSALFNSSPSARIDSTPKPTSKQLRVETGSGLHRTTSVHHGQSPRSSDHDSHPPLGSHEDIEEPKPATAQRSLFGGPMGINSDLMSPPGTPLETVREHVSTDSPSQGRQRDLADVGSPDRGVKSLRRSKTPRASLERGSTRSPRLSTLHEAPSGGIADDMMSRLSWPDVDENTHTVNIDRVKSRNSDQSREGRRQSSIPERDIRSPGSVTSTRSGTPTLKRADRRLSGDLRAASKRYHTKPGAKSSPVDLALENIPSSSTYDPVTDKGKGPAQVMADVYGGWGEVPGSPLSPARDRPPSMRKRQSMQQIQDLEGRLDQLASENRLLVTAKINAEQELGDLHFAQNRAESATQEALETRDLHLKEKDTEIGRIREDLDWLQKEVTRLTEINEGLTATNVGLASNTNDRFGQLQAEHAETRQRWQESTKELDTMRAQHAQLSTGMEEIVRHEISTALAEKNAEINRLNEKLDITTEKVRDLQQKILASKKDDETLNFRDEDYFDGACQQLCQHVQQWVLRFSKFSDTRICRLTSEIRDEKIVDRFDNAILDGTEVDVYLADRTRRRDVFMSVVMTMVWEFIFTRYLFGMDREQRQKLKSLEKNLSEVGPASSVHRWRAITLSLLCKRETFQSQRASDTEAVVQEIYLTLAKLLPPPHHLKSQIQDSLRNVMKAAVDLSIEMRTQRAEYIMLPPLQPDYDTNGDLARKVYFNSALMNERSGETTSNEDLEAQQAVVRTVLFPLVVKKGSDSGEGDDEIVVCPAQVLVAKAGKEKQPSDRVVSGDRMSIDQGNNRSVHSFAPSSMDMGNVI